VIKILVVEDQQNKKQLIIHQLTSSGIPLASIAHTDNVVDAKRLIKKNRYDLLILDINLPDRADCQPSKGAGLKILEFIKNNHQAKSPTYIFGMTALEEEFAEASLSFSSALWKLVRYGTDGDTWRRSLTDAVTFLISRDTPPYKNDGVNFHTDVGVVVALEEEMSPLKEMMPDWNEIKVPHDPARYFSGTLDGLNRKLSVIVVTSPRMGLPTAAVSATKLILHFRPQYLVTCGICAGVRDKTKIGDLLVADPSFDWGSGKWIKKEDNKLHFKPAAYPWRLNESVRTSITALADDASAMRSIFRSYDGNRPENIPQVSIDAMASGGAVLQASSLMNDVRAQHKNLVGIDMENYSILTAAEYCGEPQPKALAIKSVCDFGDDDKNDDFHGYAAHVSANFVCELLRRMDID
jgi:nucleoside phosphorylase/CheY-like chemotaxis protein